MAVNSCEENQDAHSIMVVADETTSNPPYESQLATSSHSEVSNPLNNTRMCLDAKLNCQTCIKQEMVSADAVPPCIVDIYVDKGHSVSRKPSETGEKLKIEGPLTHFQRGLQRQISLQIGEKLMQLLLNDSSVLPKFISREKSATERVHETPTSRTRKYKRSASFDSRKVLLLFSLLSIVGTMVLICLTLRVRHISDG
ncbi:hypothetical protein Vadar_000643 [Vaccinium darrowii]|uniref:Uncharacterized protein n=1 Tax=Vaccinium darrowii TaxID=229202 RepID=A0ACB7YAW1_9ERIC|nr:hypothetical protein Vadar_000643 [Vaccinium darrowii]